MRRFGGTGNFGHIGPMMRGRRLYAGEAAGFQDALFGFGLRYAATSGCLAGRAVSADAIAAFADSCRSQLEPMYETALANRWLYEHLGPSGRQYILAHLIAGRDPRAVLGRLYKPVRWKRWLAQLIAAPPVAFADIPDPECDCTWCRCHRDRPQTKV